MPLDVQIVTSMTLLVLLRSPEVPGLSQETSYMIECIRDAIPMQIYNDCCLRENNCTVARQQNRAIDCMSRNIMSNYSSFFSDSRESGSSTTEMNHRRHQQWYGDLLEVLADACRSQPRARLQTCIRNELIKNCASMKYSFISGDQDMNRKDGNTQTPTDKEMQCFMRCRYSMLQDRITNQPSRWITQRRTDRDPGYSDGYGGRMEYRRTNHGFGGRRNQDGHYMSRPMDFGLSTDSRYSRSGYRDDMDDEEFGYSDSDSSRFK
ncbi:uncharacterized protein LOC129220544 isoform X1 [Uloborus diversus]|uniref:uncharacterized protein LOC129220544 isoform X1 n=1 Tax=Uloborus diversus TaxID=327109 RepID=UPI00240A016F|nr:uncharacterized protein LOC129220544 isoform X1 [Uloborus diversus]